MPGNEMTFRTALSLAALLGAAGCTWVSDADFQAKQSTVDDDGDGYVQSEDCDDKDATIHPDAEDAWYDGIDSDCAQDDDYDQDLDGYVDDEYVGLATAGVEGTGTLPGGDCDDLEAGVNPAQEDEWYDGIDTDCSGNNDYDQDGDGYVIPNAEGLATTYAEDTATDQGGDCEDTVDSVYPGAADAWYDGVDTDCAGNDDFDQDGDGYVPDEYINLTTRYVSGSGGLPGGDCDDDPSQDGTAPVPAASTYPGAPDDAVRDGWDADCAGDDDFDGDLDGYVSDDNEGVATQDGYGDIEGTGLLPAGDCDDDNADINPLGIEQITDSADYDCDGDAGTFVMGDLAEATAQLYELGWTEPSDLVFDANSSEVWLSVRAPEVVITRDSSSGPLTPTTYYENAFAFGSDRSDPASGILEIADWWRYTGGSAPYSITPGHDFIAEDGVLYGIIGLQLSTGRAMRLIGFDLSDGSRFGQSSRLLYNGSSTLADFAQLSLMMDDAGVLHAVGCEASDGVLHYVRATEAQLDANNLESAALYGSMPMTSCALSPDHALLGRNGAAMETWLFDEDGTPPSFTLDSTDTGNVPTEVKVLTSGVNQWTVLADFSTFTIKVLTSTGATTTLPTQGTPRSLHAALVHGGAGVPDLVVSYTNTAGEAWFIRYDPTTGTSTEHQLSIDVQARDAAVFIDVDTAGGVENVYAAVASTTEVLYGWGRY